MSLKDIDSFTKLLPYNGTRYSPIKRPPLVGELAITMSDPRGYCVVVIAIRDKVADVVFLDDSTSRSMTYDLCSLIPTGKTPLSLLDMYPTTPQSLDRALEKEREQIDYSLLKVRKKGGSTTKKKKEFNIGNMTEDQKAQLTAFFKTLMKGGTK